MRSFNIYCIKEGIHVGNFISPISSFYIHTFDRKNILEQRENYYIRVKLFCLLTNFFLYQIESIKDKSNKAKLKK